MDDSEHTSQMLPIDSATPQNANPRLFHHSIESRTLDSGIWETLEAGNRNCAVCGEANSKKYYGQYTCEACKAFFQQTIMGNLLYERRCNGQCTVDVKTRHRCQYCRLQKCLQVGIRAEIAFQQTLPCFFPFAHSGDERDPNPSETCETFKFLPRDILSALKCSENLLGTSISRTCIIENYVNWARNMPFFDSLNWGFSWMSEKMSNGRSPPRIEGMISLKVDNLAYRTTVDDLRKIFSRYGDVGDVYIPRNPYSMDSRGFAFVRYYNERDAEDAIRGMDGRKIDGREIRVQRAMYGRPSTRRRGSRWSPSPRRRRSRSRSYSPRRRSSRDRHESSGYRRDRYRDTEFPVLL
nr:Splicing factor arginine:serine rich 2 [Hymenolepis microstoma]